MTETVFLKININKKPAMFSHEIFPDSPRLPEDKELVTIDAIREVTAGMYAYAEEVGVNLLGGKPMIDRVKADDINSFFLIPVFANFADNLLEVINQSAIVESTVVLTDHEATDIHARWEKNELVTDSTIQL